ncbi:MAG TPA: esterase-like activity of phytase family protein [Albidovulum sp.]|uniref:esterase-like activity of phytase family protein n=1 Tax=Albidovulum sp. TaxID=1872424 RepID=UPI002D0EB3AB|nr:esterase-like activity of phytase family protein [Albidovulum sp.]
MRWISAGFGLFLALSAHPAAALELVFLQSLDWSEDNDDFGGFSGLVVTDMGQGFWAASDRGTLWQAGITRGADGRIEAIKARWHDRFLDNGGKGVSGFTSDAESLAPAPDGGLFVGYESYTRVTGLHPPSMRSEPLHKFDRFKDRWNNGSFEGLARIADGSLMAVVEERDAAIGGYPTFIGRKGGWQAGPVLRTGPDFGASDATMDDEGRLWLLERRLTWLGQFEVRVSTCPAVALRGVVDCAPVMTAPSGALGNMEGMSVWRDAAGRQIMTLISDDNFFPFSSTLVAEYEILP